MRSAFLRLLPFALAFLVQAKSYASESTAPRYVLLDARSFDSDLADVFTAVAASSSVDEWRTVRGSASDDLTKILAREYNLTPANAERYPRTNEALRAVVQQANLGIKVDLVPLPEGPIRIPPLPSLPNWGTARPDLVQVQGKGHKYFVTHLSSLLSSRDGELQPERRQLAEAGTIAFLDEFKDQLNTNPRTGLRRLYTGPIKDYPVKLLQAEAKCNTSASKPVEIEVPPSVRERISKIPDSAAGNLYIFDFDLNEDSCSHGKKVHDVVIELLKRYGAAHLANQNHVKTIDVNYYAHPLEVRETLNMIVNSVLESSLHCQYGQFFAQSFDARLDSCDQSIADIPVSATVDQAKHGKVPGFYLWLLYEYILDSTSQASVATSSFYTVSDGFDVGTSEQLGEWPALVTAVLNPDSGGFSPAFKNLGNEQPMKQFFIKRREYGTFLVGALLRDGSSFGMTGSEQYSDAVTAFALGEGYGTVDSNAACFSSCITPEDRGTSFATPAVAVQLYLARALWRTEAWKSDPSTTSAQFGASKDPVDVMEAKRRLALSASVDPALIGKAAAAGLPQFERLVSPSRDVIVRNDHSLGQSVVTEAQVKVNGTILSYADYEHGFGGIQVHDGAVFVYDESRNAWRKADNEGFAVRLQDGSEFHDPISFSAAYNSIARYK